MSSHELARQLLQGPDLPVVCGLDRTGYGEQIDFVGPKKAHPYDNKLDNYAEHEEDVIELTLSPNSSYCDLPVSATK